MFICHAHLTSISFHPAVCAQACGLEHLCHHRALLDIRFRDIFGLCVGVTIAVTRHCHFCKRFRDGRSTVGSGARRGTKPWRGNGKRVDGDTAVGPRFGQEPLPSFEAPTPACTCRQWKRGLRLGQHHCRTAEVDRFCDSSKARVGLQQMLSWTMRWCDPEPDAPTTAPRSEVWIQPSVERTSLGRGSHCITRGQRFL